METTNKTVQDRQEAHSVIMIFLTQVNTVEFFVNAMNETIAMHFGTTLTQPMLHDALQFIEKESMAKRINLLLLFLSIAKNGDPGVEQIIARLSEFIKTYNKKIRDIRDFIAHNPYLPSTGKIISTRLYQARGKMNSVSIQQIKDTTELVIPWAQELNLLAGRIQAKYKTYIVRSKGDEG